MTWNRYRQGVAEALGAPTPALVYIPTDLLGKVTPKRASWCVENFQFNNIFEAGRGRCAANLMILPYLHATVSWRRF